jgi:nicotinamide-nucleotide amidase
MMSAQECAAALIHRARASGVTIATGESLTAGWVASELAAIPGASAVLRGGIIAYSADVKQHLLGVTTSALASGVVSREVAIEMARGASLALGTDMGVATTGVAGPEAHDGAHVGSVWIAVSLGDRDVSAHHEFTGDRQRIREETVRAALLLCADVLSGE